MRKAGGKIILGITGSIAAFKSAELVSRFAQANFDVRVIMTKEAEHFITPLTLQVLSGNKVYNEMFDTQDVWDVEHVGLADWADVVLIAPATANVIAKLAGGFCDDLLTCCVLATKAPVVIAPAMNEKMWQYPATQANTEKLKKFGFKFIGPAKGRLACGINAIGRMSDVDEIIKETKKILATYPSG